MKIIYTFCTVCIFAIHVETQIENRKQTQFTSNNYPRYDNSVIYFTPNPELSGFDKYLYDIANSRTTHRTQWSSDNNNKVPQNGNRNNGNRFNGPGEDVSPIASNAVRFMEVRTDVEPVFNVTHAITNFGINLIKNVNHMRATNVIVSPTSVATVLALLQQGTFGAVQDQITNSLQITPNVTAPTYQRLTFDMKKRNSRNILTVANHLFVGDGFEINPDFKNSAIQNFGSEVTQMDFSRPTLAVNQINKWISTKTHNKIENLLPYSAVTPATQLVITNAVYFKGLWENKFKKEATKNLIFHLSNGESKSVPFMRMRQTLKYGTDRESRARIVILPFEGYQYSLMLILPHQLSNVDTVLGSLTNTKLVSFHDFPEIETQLGIPKFTVKSDTNLIPVLKRMGVTDIFSKNADLTRIGSYRTHSPEISSAIHTGYLSIDENGVSAAAATSFAAVALSYDDPSATFQANRPFLSVLWDTQLAIPLFIARIEDPSME